MNRSTPAPVPLIDRSATVPSLFAGVATVTLLAAALAGAPAPDDPSHEAVRHVKVLGYGSGV